MANFSLGEAIGLRGRFTQAEQLADYTGARLAQAAKAAAERRKADEELYADIEKNIRPPKDLQRLYKKPAQEFTTDFLVQLRKLKSEGRLAERGYDLIDQYRELMSEIEGGSDQMKDFYKGFSDQSTYTSKAQRDFKSLADKSQNIFDLGDKGLKTNIPGYNFNTYSFGEAPGQPSIATFQEKRSIEDDIRDRMRELTEVPVPPAGLVVDGQEMIEYGTQTFLNRSQANNWANQNPGAETPTTVEDQVDALMQDQEFIFQFADSRGYSFDDSERIKKDLMDMAKGYAGEEIKYKNKTRDTNIYLNTNEEPAFSDVKMTGVVNLVGRDKEALSIAGINMTGYGFETAKLNTTTNTVDENGSHVTQSMSGANLTSTVVMPTVVKNGREVPVIKQKGTYNSIDPSDIHTFRLYTVFETASRKFYMPYTEAQGQLEITKLPNDQLTRFNREVGKQTRLESTLRDLHKANKNNKNFELYKKLNTYLKSKTLDAQDPLNEYLESLIK